MLTSPEPKASNASTFPGVFLKAAKILMYYLEEIQNTQTLLFKGTHTTLQERTKTISKTSVSSSSQMSEEFGTTAEPCKARTPPPGLHR
jgi:hypothetical protein